MFSNTFRQYFCLLHLPQGKKPSTQNKRWKHSCPNISHLPFAEHPKVVRTGLEGVLALQRHRHRCCSRQLLILPLQRSHQFPGGWQCNQCFKTCLEHMCLHSAFTSSHVEQDRLVHVTGSQKGTLLPASIRVSSRVPLRKCPSYSLGFEETSTVRPS